LQHNWFLMTKWQVPSQAECYATVPFSFIPVYVTVCYLLQASHLWYIPPPIEEPWFEDAWPCLYVMYYVPAREEECSTVWGHHNINEYSHKLAAFRLHTGRTYYSYTGWPEICSPTPVHCWLPNHRLVPRCLLVRPFALCAWLCSCPWGTYNYCWQCCKI
jgi:hypothetical protein